MWLKYSTVKQSRDFVRCGQAVKQQNDSQNFLTPVAGMTMESMGVAQTRCFPVKNVLTTTTKRHSIWTGHVSCG